MLPLHTRAVIQGEPVRPCFKVIELEEFLRSRYEPAECALWMDGSDALRRSRALDDVAWGALLVSDDAVDLASPPAATVVSRATLTRQGTCTISRLRIPQVVSPGDVIAVNGRAGGVSVLFRRASRSNSILVTERCNSYCVMCSQPPVERDDSARIAPILASIRLMDRSVAEIGITGGEPTLLGEDLAHVLEALRRELPQTQIHVLSNGRRFADRTFAAQMARASSPRVMWGVPLYSDAPEVHDYVVQRAGAFVETLGGLLSLAELGQRVEVRVVLQKGVVARLPQLAHFIARNLTFVEHVAWMGLEPMGFARPNWPELWTEPEDYARELREAVTCLTSRGMATSIYNVPLCVLPEDLRPYAARSISDWKNQYLPECEACSLKASCCGFFASAGREHVPRSIRPFRESA